MNDKKKARKIFLSFTFSWSFLFWGIGIYLGQIKNLPVLENADLFRSFLNRSLSSEQYLIALINIIAGYGPLFGTIMTSLLIPEMRSYFKGKFKGRVPLKYFLQVIILFLLITLVPAVALTFRSGLAVSLSVSTLSFFLFFFIYQLLTAGTEEIGWRGYLLPSMLETKTPWEASVRIGMIWAFWHTPIILYVFYMQGLSILQILFSFAGFIAGTIGMATIHTYYYLKTKDLLFNVFIHAISNSFPMFVGMLFAHSFELSVAVQFLLWGFVWMITQKNKTLFDTVQGNDS